MADPQIKSEVKEEESPDVGMPPADDEDLYEDAGDLEFFDPNVASNQQMYLGRLPKYLWESWAKLVEGMNDDDQVQIGTMRTWQTQEPNGDPKVNFRMLLKQHADHQGLPQEYNVEIINREVSNHYIFSEEDLPGFKARSKARANAAQAGIPAALLRPKNEVGYEKKPYDRKARYQPYYRKAVPKKTKIYGKVLYDLRVEPMDKREEEELMNRRIFKAENDKQKVQIISREQASAHLHAGTGSAALWGGNFIKNTQPLAKPKKGEVFKAARIPKNQLLDMLFQCFRDFQYWPMKALRKHTQQPDSYLRETLSEIAVLNKSGAFANTYCLNEAYASQIGKDAKAEVAADQGADDDEDEDEEMEDVVPGA